MVDKILIKRGTSSELASYTPDEGELVLNLDTEEIYVGDGVTEGGILSSVNCADNTTAPEDNTSVTSTYNKTSGGNDVTEVEILGPGGFTEPRAIFDDIMELNLGRIGSFNDHGDYIQVNDNGIIKIFTTKPLLSGTSWHRLDAYGLIHGRIFEIGSTQYRVRVMSGANSDVATPGEDGRTFGFNIDAVKESEWNRLMYAVHATQNDISLNNDTGSYAFDSGNLSLTDSDLGIGPTADHPRNICSDTSSAGSNMAVCRGELGISDVSFIDKFDTSGVNGFRPVFERLGEDGLLNIAPTPPPPTYGNLDLGFYGLVREEDLITMDEIRNINGIGEHLSLGVYEESHAKDSYHADQNTQLHEALDVPEHINWIHMVDNGVEKYFPERPIANSVTWDALNDAFLIYGTQTVEIDDKLFIIRLMKGLDGESPQATDWHSDTGFYTDLPRTNDEYTRLVLGAEGTTYPNTDFDITRGFYYNDITGSQFYDAQWYQNVWVSDTITNTRYDDTLQGIVRRDDTAQLVGFNEESYYRTTIPDEDAHPTKHWYHMCGWLPVLERIR